MSAVDGTWHMANGQVGGPSKASKARAEAKEKQRLSV